jgi:hypothetical protein
MIRSWSLGAQRRRKQGEKDEGTSQSLSEPSVRELFLYIGCFQPRAPVVFPVARKALHHVAGASRFLVRCWSEFLFGGYATKRNEPGILFGLASSLAHKVMTLTRNMRPRQVSGTALGPDLGRIASLANTIRKRSPMIDIAALPAVHTHRLARICATDAERAFDCLSGVVHLPRLL